MLICFFDYTSAASAVALTRLQPIVDAGGAVAFAGIDVLGLEAGVPATLDQLEELQRVAGRAQALGLQLRRPRWRPPTLAAHLVGEHADRLGLGASWREVALHAYWRDGADLADTAVLVELAVGAGLDGLDVAARLADRSARIELRQRMTRVRGRGVGGVPVLEVDGTLVSADLPDDDLAVLARP